MRIGYVRVSTVDQNEARQVEALKAYDVEKVFIEKASGKDRNRPQLQIMMDFAREGDTVYVEDFSRLARSTEDLLHISEELNGKNVQLVSLKERFDTSTPTGKLMLTVIGAIAEFERQTILERQREGIAIAKAKGVYKGRKKLEVPKEFPDLYSQWMAREITKTQIARTLNISRPTVERFFHVYEEKRKEECQTSSKNY